MELGAFTPAASSALPGDPWQRRRRAEAVERLRGLPLPTTAEEDWRYSRIDELDLARFGPVEGARALAAASVLRLNLTASLLASLAPLTTRVRSVDGVVAAIDPVPAGVTVRSGATLEEPPEQLGELVAPHHDSFLALSDAFAPDVAVIDVAEGAQLEGPIAVAHELMLTEDRDARCPAVFPRTLLRLGAGAKATVIEVVSSGPGRRLVVPVTEVELGPGAQLDLYGIQQLGRDAWHLGYQASRLAREARLLSFVAALGGDYARQLTRCSLEGDGAESRLLAVYLGDGEQMQDLRTFQEHVAPRTRSELVFKGAVAGKARSVYTGLIAMRKGARRADASQTNRNLVLSEGAHADSVPNLDIEENDVRCSHASAVGPIDPELIFYLESRGVQPDAARRLLLLGFFEDLLSGLALRPAADHVREAVNSRLGSVSLDEADFETGGMRR
jgi:Fe-S cluster assembly protein SufD